MDSFIHDVMEKPSCFDNAASIQSTVGIISYVRNCLSFTRPFPPLQLPSNGVLQLAKQDKKARRQAHFGSTTIGAGTSPRPFCLMDGGAGQIRPAIA